MEPNDFLTFSCRSPIVTMKPIPHIRVVLFGWDSLKKSAWLKHCSKNLLWLKNFKN